MMNRTAPALLEVAVQWLGPNTEAGILQAPMRAVLSAAISGLGDSYQERRTMTCLSKT